MTLVAVNPAAKNGVEVSTFDLTQAAVASLTDTSDSGYSIDLEFNAAELETFTIGLDGTQGSGQSGVIGDLSVATKRVGSTEGAIAVVASTNLQYLINFEGMNESGDAAHYLGWSEIAGFSFSLDGLNDTSGGNAETGVIAQEYQFDSLSMRDLFQQNGETVVILSALQYAVQTTGIDSAGDPQPLSAGFDTFESKEISFTSIDAPSAPSQRVHTIDETHIAKIGASAGGSLADGKTGWFDVAELAINFASGGFGAGFSKETTFTINNRSDVGLAGLLQSLATGDPLDGIMIESMVPTGTNQRIAKQYLFNSVFVTDVTINPDGAC